MRGRFWVAYGALALALALLVPTLAPLSGSMDAFAKDLADGAFRPFGTPGRAPAQAYSGSLGGFTGQSEGNYLPGAQDIPQSWVMDRDGRGGNVVVDAVFNPSLGAMKRLKAFDKVEADGSTLSVHDTRLRPYQADPLVEYDTPIDASFDVSFRPNEPIPIFSPHPRALIRTYSTSPPIGGTGVRFFQDGADTLYAMAPTEARVKLNISFSTDSRYYELDVPPGLTADLYETSVRPVVPANVREDAEVVLARAGANPRDVGQTLQALSDYFRSFTEGEIPPPTEVESLYLALALGGHGCCRHRAFAFMVTAQAVGIPTRVVVNEAHAFVEVMMPNGLWHQINLGGCGSYTVNNPNNYRDLFDQAHDPRGEANPNEDRPLPTVVTFTNITESPERILKGERYFVNGTVETAGGRPVPGARVDVFLNETKEAPGRLTGAGTTDARGQFSIVSRVPKELGARDYQLVARAEGSSAGSVRYLESWSDPPVEVFAPTKFVLPKIVAAAGFPTAVTGRLLDVDNNPLVLQEVTWSVDGASQPPMATDDTGRFTSSITFQTEGDALAEFRYAGGEHHGATTATLTIQVGSGALLLPLEAPTLARGETGSLPGSVAIAGLQLGGREVSVTMLESNASTRIVASGTGTTDAEGRFVARVDVPRTLAPGLYPIRVFAEGLNLSASGLARVAIRPTLEVEAPGSVPHGEPWVVRVTVRSDNGTTLSGGIVEVTIDGNASTTRPLLTNRTGVARFEFPAGTLDAGEHDVRVRFPGDAAHAEAEQSVRIGVARPWFEAVPAWVYLAALAALMLVGGLAYVLRPGGTVRRQLAALRHARATRLRPEASFPDHPYGVAPVFEPREEIAIRFHVRHRDGRLVPGWLAIETPDRRERGRASGAEGFTLRLLAPESGPLRLRARGVGLARLWTAPVDLEVPVHSYRQAVEAGFVALRARARLAPSASPADLVRSLGPRLPSAQQQKLREAAALFEVADYSERPVDRAFYHQFAIARRDLEKLLGGADPG